MDKKDGQGKEPSKSSKENSDEQRGKGDICCICKAPALANINGKDYCVRCFPGSKIKT